MWQEDSLDSKMRNAAFEHVRKLTADHGTLPWSRIAEGFRFGGEKIHLATRAKGIFKPRQMRTPLSIRTGIPKPGRKIWYDDQHDAHRNIFEGTAAVDYAFQGEDPAGADNRLLHEAHRSGVPIIYFLGVAPGQYQAIAPTYIVDWDGPGLKARIAFGLQDWKAHDEQLSAAGQLYAMTAVKRRLHQAKFRQSVILAYGSRCTLSELREARLLDAAHIVADRDEMHGNPVVSNGLPLSKIHHAAFDSNLIGVDPDYRVHVAESLLGQRDGPMLEALQQLHGQGLRLPVREQDRPDRWRLEHRFADFRRAS